MAELTYEQGLLFAIRTVQSLQREVDEYLAGYCHAAGHLLGEILDAVTDITFSTDTNGTNDADDNS